MDFDPVHIEEMNGDLEDGSFCDWSLLVRGIDVDLAIEQWKEVLEGAIVEGDVVASLPDGTYVGLARLTDFFEALSDGTYMDVICALTVIGLEGDKPTFAPVLCSVEDRGNPPSAGLDIEMTFFERDLKLLERPDRREAMLEYVVGLAERGRAASIVMYPGVSFGLEGRDDLHDRDDVRSWVVLWRDSAGWIGRDEAR